MHFTKKNPSEKRIELKNKLKKNKILNLNLTLNIDVLKQISKEKNRPKFLVGFAAESG